MRLSSITCMSGTAGHGLRVQPLDNHCHHADASKIMSTFSKIPASVSTAKLNSEPSVLAWPAHLSLLGRMFVYPESILLVPNAS